MRFASLAAFLPLLWLVGCAGEDRINPSFPVSVDHAQTDSGKPDRPSQAAGSAAGDCRRIFRSGSRRSHDAQPIRELDRRRSHPSISLGFCFTIEQCRRHIIEEVDKAFPTNDPNATTEVDVIGFSLGGLSSRYAAEDPKPGMEPQRRLRIARLFTISSPLRRSRRGREYSAGLSIPVGANDDARIGCDSSGGDAAERPTRFTLSIPMFGCAIMKLARPTPLCRDRQPWWVEAPPLIRPHGAGMPGPAHSGGHSPASAW